MATRRKKVLKRSNLFYLLGLLCAVCLSYKPITKALETNGISLPKVLGKLFDATGKPATIEKTATADNVKGLECPAPLQGVSERILHRRTFTVSFNASRNVPNWVAWKLTPEKLVERESRSNKFLPDPDLSESQAVTTQDYSGSGWDRGHMCPAADNRWHWRAMQESFYMTNICPQHHELNRGDWRELEEACRRWAEETGSIYICCGPIFYSRGPHRAIGREHRIDVPDAFFKVVLCSASQPPHGIGFLYKNTAGNHPLDSYVNTIDQVERITGIDFFPALPDEIENKVESVAAVDFFKVEEQ